MKSNIRFVNERLEKTFKKLEKDDPQLHKFILRAFSDIENNAFCGIQVPKRLIPEEYAKKLSVRNVWMDHKTYERRFKY
jgi:hypothetical protein